MVMEEEIEILKPYELHYSDLISLSSINNTLQSSSSSCEIRRLQSVNRAIMDSLGPTGPGLIAIIGVPDASGLRRNLLPLARDLTLLSDDHRKRILKDHGLGSDVPLKNLDRSVSSFSMQLKYGKDLDAGNVSCENPDGSLKPCGEVNFFPDDANKKLMVCHFKDLGCNFRELGFIMVDIGLLLARICDRAIGGKVLENSLLESGTAKGRLIHYHSTLDTHIIRESGRRNGSKKGKSYCWNEKNINKSGKMRKDVDDARPYEEYSKLWQQWHYDYGTFTVLTSPMFVRPNCKQIENGENSYLQILHPLKSKICIVKTPPESFIVQVGESADILSKRKLHSTLHSVLWPKEIVDLCRETFVVFLHPAWNKVFDISDYPMEQNVHLGMAQDGRNDTKNLTQEICKIIPPLSSRLKDGMTFATFSRETTRQYYGGSGLQSNR